MAKAIEKALKIKPRLIEGRGGVFDVEVDGRLLYSKHATGEFPDPAEIIGLLKP